MSCRDQLKIQPDPVIHVVQSGAKCHGTGSAHTYFQDGTESPEGIGSEYTYFQDTEEIPDGTS